MTTRPWKLRWYDHDGIQRTRSYSTKGKAEVEAYFMNRAGVRGVKVEQDRA